MSSITKVETVSIAVGFDTARYGHHATFLRSDLQPAAKPFEFLESRDGYRKLEATLTKLADKHDSVHFHLRVDAAGQYAANLLRFLHQLPYDTTISVGEPLRNKRYREVHFPKRKADAVDSYACARFAVVEQPAATYQPSDELLVLQEVASRLEFQSKQSTRQVNRLHNLLARVFPELAFFTNDLKAGWVLRLLEKYPTAGHVARARSLAAIPRLSHDKAKQIQEAAAQSVASQQGEVIESLVRQTARDLKQTLQVEQDLEQLLIKAFQQLPDERAKQIVTIKGVGERTAAVLVAKIGDIRRFATAAHLTGYFGVFPEEVQSGMRKDGTPLPPGTLRMSRKGNDLVRKYLWMASQSAICFNPQVKALYARMRSRGRRGDVALGHCMKKLLHQVFGIWTSGKPYDPEHDLATTAQHAVEETTGEATGAAHNDQQTHHTRQAGEATKTSEAKGRKTGVVPLAKTVTSASSDIVVAEPPVVKPQVSRESSAASIDFPHLRSQVTMEQVLRHLGYFGRLRGRGQQRRGPCPVHGTKRAKHRTFSVHLGKNVFQCFHPPCTAAGNVLDLWCAVHGLTPYEAARHLAETFDLQLTRNTHKRNP